MNYLTTTRMYEICESCQSSLNAGSKCYCLLLHLGKIQITEKGWWAGISLGIKLFCCIIILQKKAYSAERKIIFTVVSLAVNLTLTINIRFNIFSLEN